VAADIPAFADLRSPAALGALRLAHLETIAQEVTVGTDPIVLSMG
jgi:hypothetical protein